MQDYSHSPTSSTWGGGTNQELDQSTLGPSPYGRNAQSEVVSPQQQQHRVLLSQTMPMRPLAPGHGGVGSGPPAWETGRRGTGDIEAGYHDPNSYFKMESRPYLGDDKVSSPTVKLEIPKRPQRPATSGLNPLVGIGSSLLL